MELNKLKQEISLGRKILDKISNVKRLSVATSVVVLLVVLLLFCNCSSKKPDFGSYDNPEVAFKETQRGLGLLSNNVNIGIESVYYIKEYQNSKELIFKQ